MELELLIRQKNLIRHTDLDGDLVSANSFDTSKFSNQDVKKYLDK